MKQNNTTRFPDRVVLGLTGTIASGKSTVMNYLKNRTKALAIDADLVARGVVEEMQEDLQKVFGADVVKDGHVDRTRLGQIVFHDPDKLQMLNQMVHPRTADKIREMIEASDKPLIIVEAIELLRSDLNAMVDEVLVVYADPALRIQRMMESRHLTFEQAKSRVDSQWEDQDYLERADIVIPSTNEGLDVMFQRVEEALKELCQRYPAVLTEPKEKDYA